jgi:hypothetical protein
MSRARTWRESARSVLLKQKTVTGDKHARTCSSRELGESPPDPLDQEPVSHLDAPGIIHLHHRFCASFRSRPE